MHLPIGGLQDAVVNQRREQHFCTTTRLDENNVVQKVHTNAIDIGAIVVILFQIFLFAKSIL
jgi:hypothetical protein